MLTIQLPHQNSFSKNDRKPISPFYYPPSHGHDWADEAMEILSFHSEMEERHLLIDGMIGYVQEYYQEASHKLNPSRKAFSFFFQEKQPKIAMVHKKRGLNEKFQIAKKVSLWWKRMTAEEKRIYYLLETIDQLRYDQEFEKIKYRLRQDVENIETMRSHLLTFSSKEIKDWVNKYKQTLISM